MVDWQLEEQLLSWHQSQVSQLCQLREQQPLSCGVKDQWKLFIMLTLSDIYTYLNRCRQTEITFTQPFYQYGGHIELLDLRSIMGCPGGTRLVFAPAFRVKRELHGIFQAKKKAIIITSKHGTTIFFFPWKSFLWENLKKNWPKSAHKYWASISDSAHAPLVSHNTP